MLKNTKRLEDLRAEVGGLEAKKTELEAQIQYKTTPEYIEEKARNDLNLVKPGEKVYVVAGINPEVKFSSEQNDFLALSKNAEKGSVGGLSDYRSASWYQWYSLFFK